MVAGVIAEYMMAAPSGQTVFVSSAPANTTGVWTNGLTSGGNVQWSFTVSSASNRLLVVGYCWQYVGNNTLANLNITFAGQTLTRLDSQVTAAGSYDIGGCGLWYLVNPPATANSISINAGTQGATISLLSGALLFSGVNQTTPFVSSKKDTTTVSANYSTYTNTISSSVSNMVVGIGCAGANVGNVHQTGANTRFVWKHDINTTSGNYVIGTWPGASTTTTGFDFNNGVDDVYSMVIANINAAY